MSVQRVLHMIALLLFILFVATFFTVLVRLSRIGLVAERYAHIESEAAEESPPVTTLFELLGQDHTTGRLRFHVVARIDTHLPPFDRLLEGDTLVVRIENLVGDLRGNQDREAVFGNPTGDRFVNIDFGEVSLEVNDRRDFYPFDGYEVSINFAYHVPSAPPELSVVWHQPGELTIKSLTNLIFLNPRYSGTRTGVEGFRFRVARLRIQQFLTATLILIEILFLIYLITIVNLQELLAKALGYVVGLYVIRNILVTNAPQFPTIVDYGTLFLTCVVFFLMLFRFLGGTEERALITLPPPLRNAFGMRERSEEESRPPERPQVEEPGREDESADGGE